MAELTEQQVHLQQVLEQQQQLSQEAQIKCCSPEQ